MQKNCLLLSVSLLGAALPATIAQADEPTVATVAANRAVLNELPFKTDTRDQDWASRGFIADIAPKQIRDKAGNLVWDVDAANFLKADAPDTVNPSLWRVSQLYGKTGIFKAAERVYQVRGVDLANLTVVLGDKGWIVIDPLTVTETADAAFALVRKHIADLPVTAIIYTHSHGDHYGGAGALMPFAIKDVPVIAPAHFMEETISEAVLAGTAMQRRAVYQFGTGLGFGPKERVGVGLALGLATGTTALVPPTQTISRTGEELVVDGVRMQFQITSGTEAPSEFNIGFPDLGVVNIAENANPSHHNILTPRGAKVRDAKAWAESLTEAVDMFDYANVLVVSHGWPVFGRAEITDYLSNQRDAYAFLHDQTVRLMNKGLTPEEIAADFELPEKLAKQWYNRPYYGDYRFNTRAVYQFYLGWFDGNPVHLAPLPPERAGKLYVEAMGGPEAVLQKARAAYDKGDYQWASVLLDRLVFSGAGGDAATTLLAQTYRQMGWQSENALARNFYLTAAAETTRGPTSLGVPGAAVVALFAALPTSDLFDIFATRLDPDKAGDADMRLGLAFPDRKEQVTITVRNGVLVHRNHFVDAPYDARLTIDRPGFLAILAGGAAVLKDKIAKGEAALDGDEARLAQFAAMLDKPDPAFAIVTP